MNSDNNNKTAQSEKADLTLHDFFKKFFNNKIKSVDDSLIEISRILFELRIGIRCTFIEKRDKLKSAVADKDFDKILIGDITVKDNGDIFIDKVKYKISTESPYKDVSSELLYSIDHKPRLKKENTHPPKKKCHQRTEIDCIREIIFDRLLMGDAIKMIADYLSGLNNKAPLKKDQRDFIADFCENGFRKKEQKINAKTLINGLENDYEKLALVFAFLCFPMVNYGNNKCNRGELLEETFKSKKLRDTALYSNATKPVPLAKNIEIHNVNSSNTGRDEVINKIKAEISDNNSVTLYGIGGIGKTYICRKLYYDYLNTISEEIKYLVWIQYTDDLERSITTAFVDLEADLAVPEERDFLEEKKTELSNVRELDKQKKIIEKIFRKLGGSLLIFIDNANSMTVNEKNWLNSINCRKIISSRSRIEGFFNINVNAPDPDYCKQLYKTIYNPNSRRPLSEQDEKCVNEIIKLANYHTYTVILIAKANRGISAEKMLEKLNRSGFVLKSTDGNIESDVSELSKLFDIKNITDEEQIKTLKLFSLLAPNIPIEISTLQNVLGQSSPSSINNLVESSWILDEGPIHVSMHPVISDVVRYKLNPEYDFFKPYMGSLLQKMYTIDDVSEMKMMLSHFKTIADRFDTVEDIDFAGFLFPVAMLFPAFGTVSDLLILFDKTITTLEKNKHSQDFDESDEAEYEYIIGEKCKYEELSDQAVIHYKNAIKLTEKKPEYNVFLPNMYLSAAQSYFAVGNYSETLLYLDKGCDYLSRDHEPFPFEPDIHTFYLNKALCYSALGDHVKESEFFDKAEAMINPNNNLQKAMLDYYFGIAAFLSEKYKEASVYLEKTHYFKEFFGGNNALSDSIDHQLIDVYIEQEEFDKAIDALNDKLKNLTAKLPSDHPKMAETYLQFAEVYDEKEELERSLEYYNKAIACINDSKKGINTNLKKLVYSGFLSTTIKMIHKMIDQHMISEALYTYVDNIKLIEQVYNTEHPEIVIDTYYIIAKLYSDQGYTDKSLIYLKKALSLREKVLGEEHPDTATSYDDVGMKYYDLEDFDKALKYCNKALFIRKKVLGSKHICFFNSYNNIGRIYSTLEEFDEALKYYKKALSMLKKVLGAKHPDTALSYLIVGCNYFQLEEYNRALEYSNIALAIQEKELGTEHPETIRTMEFIEKINEELSEL